ncbi:glycosyltransferase [Christiangramia crocea]|uniref:Glycosyltransferase n=1 Tax=Christiangramia crocea TaxID=2904124 RepID=A0A9X1UUD5_9FLAO|nr:glycosyltransferase [Gramella crocea]MCG9970433.1 glycosyltransferase [Gramella crocea]
MRHYSVVIPVYKSTKSLETIAEKFAILESKENFRFELIFVNDSPCFIDTQRTLEKISNKFNNVSTVTLRRNQGQQLALLVGMSRASGEYVLTMDDDLQHPVEEVPKLIRAMKENKDTEAIFAVPSFKNKKHSLWRNLGSYIVNKIDRVFLNKPEGLVKSSFRIMTKELARTIVLNYNAMPALSSLIISSTNNIKNIQVEHKNREFGTSNYTITKLVNLTLNNLIHYSALPLKSLGLMGALIFGASLLFILVIIVRKIFIDINFPGYASTVSLISFFGGLNLFALGLIGEYLIRIIREQQKPKLEDMVRNNKEKQDPN